MATCNLGLMRSRLGVTALVCTARRSALRLLVPLRPCRTLQRLLPRPGWTYATRPCSTSSALLYAPILAHDRLAALALALLC